MDRDKPPNGCGEWTLHEFMVHLRCDSLLVVRHREMDSLEIALFEKRYLPGNAGSRFEVQGFLQAPMDGFAMVRALCREMRK